MAKKALKSVELMEVPTSLDERREWLHELIKKTKRYGWKGMPFGRVGATIPVQDPDTQRQMSFLARDVDELGDKIFDVVCRTFNWDQKSMAMTK